MQTAQLNSILKRQATPTKSPSVRRAKQSPKVRQPLGENPNPSRGNTPNVNAIQGALKSAFKQQPIETITKGILKDPKQNNKRKRTSDQRRISFGSVEWSTFAKDDAVTPTKDRAKAGRESLDFNFDFNFNVDEMEDHLPGDEFTASSIFPSEDDQSGVSMMEEQRPDAVSTWTSKASNLLQWEPPSSSPAPAVLAEDAPASTDVSNSPPTKKRDLRMSLDTQMTATLTNPLPDQNEFEEEDRTDVIFSLVSFNHQGKGEKGGEDEEGEQADNTMDFTTPVGAGIKMSNGSLDDKTEEFMKVFRGGADERGEGEEDDQTDTVFKFVTLGGKNSEGDVPDEAGDRQEEDEDDDQTDAIFKCVSFGAGNNNPGNTSIFEKSMDMTRLHGGAIIDYRKGREEEGDREETPEEVEDEPKKSDEEVECNDETMDFTTIVDRPQTTENDEAKENDGTKGVEEENPFAKRDRVLNSPAPGVNVFLREEERDVAGASDDDKTDMVFDMVSFPPSSSPLQKGEAEAEEREEDEGEGEGEPGEDSVSRTSLPSFSDSVLNGDDDDCTDTIFGAVSFGRPSEDGEESMMMTTEFVTPSRTSSKASATPKRTPARTPSGTPARPSSLLKAPSSTPRRALSGTPKKTPSRSPRRTPRRTPMKGSAPSSLSKEITDDTTAPTGQPSEINPFAKSSLIRNSPIVVGNNSFHNNNSVLDTSLHNSPRSMAGNHTDAEADGEEATNTLFQLVSQRQGEKGAFAENEHPSPIHQQDIPFANKSTARGVLVFGEDKTSELSFSAGSPSMASPFAHRAINDNDYDPFASSPPGSQTPTQESCSSAVSTPLSVKQLRTLQVEDSPNILSSGRFSLENSSFALTEQDLVFSTGSPAQANNSLLDWDPSSPALPTPSASASPALSSPALSSPVPSSPIPPSPISSSPISSSPISSSPIPSSPVPSSPTPSSFLAPSTPSSSLLAPSTPSSSLLAPSTPSSSLLATSALAEKSITQTPTSASTSILANTSITTTPTSKREHNPFSEEVEHSLRKLRICSKRLSDKISIHSTPITPRSRGSVRSSLGGDSTRANRPMSACEFMRSVGIGQDSSSSNTSFSKTPQRLSVMTPGGKRRKSNPNSRLTPRTMTRLTSKAGNWVTLMLDDSSQKQVPYQLVAAFAEGPHFSSLEKQLSETRKQTNDLQRRLHTLEQEIGNNNPTIFQEFSKATGVKKSILSDRLDRCYQKCLSQAKLEWLKQSANSRRLLQEELNNHKEMIKEDLSTYQKHIDEFGSLQSSPPPPLSVAPPPSSTRDPSSLAENSMAPDENDHRMKEMAAGTTDGGYSDPQKIEMWGKDMYNITASLQPWTLTSVTAAQLQFQFSSFCHVRVNFGGVLEDGGRVVTRTSIMLGKEKDSLHHEPMEWVRALVENSPAYRKWATLKTTKSLPSLLTLFSTTVRRATLLAKEIDSLRLLHHQPYILEISNNPQKQQQATLPLLTKVTFLRKNEPYFSVLFALSAEYPFAPLHHCVLGLASSSPLKSHVEDMIVSVSHAESGVGCFPLSCIVNALAQFVGTSQ